ncbi:NUDIX hydrolase [Jeotgalibacillus sp. ET6]|uniref:NUDIX hydrolase n=1 Tax=Jeotgalibacillus sp. ET6 TaxID=3037260 RepID=UPI0024182B40|nr:NUDIX hydrolase [Jeotgalibacillus sp. ET6]MDG5472187.1 NUDIX hydrolase [Jeotgalibacillus sp. ET6]
MNSHADYYGAAGVCVNEKGELLMVLQGTKEEKKKWSVPSGGREAGETFEECCIREVEEETGYTAEIVKPAFTKKELLESGLRLEVHYFLVRITGGKKTIQDPDGLIYDIEWKDAAQFQTLDLSFPEDRNRLSSYIASHQKAVTPETG